MSISVAEPVTRSEQADGTTPASRTQIVVVGNGPVGFRLLQSLVDSDWAACAEISVFGAERFPAYDRVHLTSILGDRSPDELLYQPGEWYARNGIRLYVGESIVRIDRDRQCVHSESGLAVSYDYLVLATGSTPFVPQIPGTDLDGVFVYRTIDDLIGIRTWVREKRRAVVVGGGLLGLEAAQALKQLRCDVTLVERAPVLMARHLDQTAAMLLQNAVEEAGIDVLFQQHISEIQHDGTQLKVVFENSMDLAADAVVFAAGIRPRISLAESCGLEVGRRGGIQIDDQLQTSDPKIFAIGECAEHDGVVYGLVAPGIEMANVLSTNFGGGAAAFNGNLLATRLKFVGLNVVFSGEYLDSPRSTAATWSSRGNYLRLAIRDGRLVGMMGVGDFQQAGRLAGAVQKRARIFWWHLRRFEKWGRLWPDNDGADARTWPAGRIVCSCVGVNRGTLTTAVCNGCDSVESVASETGAGTVCGSCRPHLAQICGVSAAEPPPASSRAVQVTSGIALLLLGIILLSPPVEFPSTVQTAPAVWRSLLASEVWRQATGYGCAAIILLSLGLVLRRRWRLFMSVPYPRLRTLHVVLTTVALVFLMAHTGFHHGSHLNLWLFGTFLCASLTGSGVGLLTPGGAITHRGPQLVRKLLLLAHILFLWPLPLLVTFHVVSVYWF